MKISPTRERYETIAALISAQNPRFENIKSDELKHVLAYPMAVEMVEKFWQKNALGTDTENQDVVKKVLVSYLLWPNDEAFINEYGSINVTAKDLKKPNNEAVTLLDYYGNKSDLIFLRADFILKEELKKALSQNEEAKAITYAEFIVQNEESCRLALKLALESEEAKALAVSYLLVPDDESFLQGVNNYNQKTTTSNYFNPENFMVKMRLQYLNQAQHHFKHFAVWELEKIAAQKEPVPDHSKSTVYMMEYPQKENETAEQKLEIYQKRIAELEEENAELKNAMEANRSR